MYKIKSSIFLSIICFISTSCYSQTQYYVSTLAGDTANIYLGLDFNAGYRDGVADQALFYSPAGIAIDTAGQYLYVADVQNNIIRKINTNTGMVTTIAGDTSDLKKGLDSNIGYLDASTPFTAKFNNPWGVCIDNIGNVYVADTYNNVIRKISVTGKVTTYAGRDSAGMTFNGYIDGPDSLAEFSSPLSLAVDTAGNLYVTDYGNNVIREIWASTHMVTTLTGQGPDTVGYANGPSNIAQLHSLYGIALGKNGAIYASQFGNGYNAIRRLYHDTVTTYSGYDTIGFDTLVGIVPSGYRNGYQYIYEDSIEINDLDDTSTVGVRGVLYNDPAGIAFDTSGNLLIADEYNNVIRLFTAKDSLVTTFAGNPVSNISGYINGADSVAEFYNPIGVAADKKGNFYVSDLGNNCIRIISPHNFAGVNPVKKQDYSLKAYPNPCNDRLSIVSSFNGSAALFDVTGRVVWTENNFKSPCSLSTSDISPGVYFLRITSTSVSDIKKIEIVR